MKCARPGCEKPARRKWCSDICARRGEQLKEYPPCSRCSRPNKRGGRTRVCGACYNEARHRSVRLPEPPATKVCSLCREEKPAESFYPNAARPDWLSVYCRPCHSSRAKSDYRTDADRAKDRRLWTRYNITLDEYNELLAAQDGKCAVCGTAAGGTPFSVDHSHEPPHIVRGLLCSRCNRFKVGSLTPRDAEAVFAYLHEPPALAVLGERRVPLGMEKGTPRRKRRRKRAA